MEVVTVVLVVAVVVAAVLAYSKYRHNFWAARGVPTAPGALPGLGHLTKMFSKKQYFWKYIDELYWRHGASKLCGMYEAFSPKLLVGDPELVKAILVKDFDYFVDRSKFKFTVEKDEIFNELLTITTGDHWKGVRSVLSPSFTSGRLKGMFPLVEAKADALVAHITREVKMSSSLQLKRTFGLYTLEVISSCAFGMETNSLVDGHSVFNDKVESMSKITTKMKLKFLVFMIAPKLLQALGVSLSHPDLHFFKDVVEETIKRREEGGKRGDFLDLMMEAREEQKNPDSKAPKYPLQNKTVVANSILFILAGYDTTATTLSFVTFQLARHPEQQARVRQELRDILKEHGTLTYQSVMEAKILEAVISETLRLTPPAFMTERMCTKDYKIPGTDVVVPKETAVRVPVWSLHHDPRYWPDPESFLPDRFLAENSEQVTPGTYLPFGLGPRNCIGMRFALMEAKLALAKVFLNFEVSCEPGHEELLFNTDPGIMRPAEGTSLVFTPLVQQEE